MYPNGPYVVPLAYLPVDSAVPTVPPLSRHDKRIVATTTIDAALSALMALVATMRRDILAPAELDAFMNHTAAVVQAASNAATAALRPLSTSVNRTTSDVLTTSFISSSKRPEYRQAPVNYLVYDGYFNVLRVEDMSADQFLGQMLSSFASTLADLPYSHLALAEIEALLAAMAVSLRLQLSDPAGVAEPSGPGYPEAIALQDDRAGYWFLDGLSAASRRIRNHVVATYRWIVGHHAFAIFSMLCADSMRKVDASDAERSSVRIGDAATLLRGTTAAMWYAAAMPARIYCDDLRPQMVSTNSPAGFSGAQNIEYERLKDAKHEMLALVERAWIRDGSWTSEAVDVREQILQFLEVDLEDLEHHILIASQLVGTQAPAIADQLDDEDTNSAPRQPSAVAQLREVLLKRQEVFDRFKSARYE